VLLGSIEESCKYCFGKGHRQKSSEGKEKESVLERHVGPVKAKGCWQGYGYGISTGSE